MDRRKEIIESVNADRQIMAACRSLTQGSDLANDLRQELLLTLLELDDDRIAVLYEWGEKAVRWWCVRTMLNMYRSYTSGFARKYRHNEQVLSYTDGNAADGSLHIEMFESGYNDVAEEIERDSWFDWRVFELWQKEGSVRKVAVKTGIKASTIGACVSRVSKKIKHRIK